MKRKPAAVLAPPPKVRNNATPKNIKHVLLAWGSEDDWSVRTIGVETAFELVEALEAGDDPALLAEHASHFMEDDCAREACGTLLTFHGAPRG